MKKTTFTPGGGEAVPWKKNHKVSCHSYLPPRPKVGKTREKIPFLKKKGNEYPTSGSLTRGTMIFDFLAGVAALVPGKKHILLQDLFSGRDQCGGN